MASALGDIAEVRLKGHVNGQQMRTILHYRTDVVSTLPEAGPEETALFGALLAGATSIVPKYLACISPDYTLDSMDVQFIQTLPRIVNVNNPIIGAVGTFAGTCDAQNVSAVLTKGTKFARRDQVGSVHIPGLSHLAYSGGLITNAMKTAMATLGSALIGPISPALGGGTYTPVLYHKPRVGPPPVPYYSNALQACFPQVEVRTMRRRTTGLGI